MNRAKFIGALSLVVLIASPFILELIKADSGYVLVSIGETTIQTSFWFGLFAIVVTVFLWRQVIKLFRAILRSLGVSWSFLVESRSRQTTTRTNRGLINYIEGNWEAAKKDLLSVAKYADQPLVHYLAAAHSAHQMGDLEACQELLSQAEKVAPENELAVLLSQAKMQLSAKQYEQCLATLERARTGAPRHPVLLELLRVVYMQVNDWQAVLDLIPQLRKTRNYSDDNLQALEVEASAALMQTHRFNLEELTGFWHHLAKHLKASGALVEQYSELLIAQQQYDKAEQQLRQALTKNWNKSLITLYGKAAANNSSEQLLIAEQWLRQRPGDADLLLALARISMRNKLWGKARSYFESSLQLQANPQAYAELAALLAQLGDHQKSTELYQKGLVQLTKKELSV